MFGYVEEISNLNYADVKRMCKETVRTGSRYFLKPSVDVIFVRVKYCEGFVTYFWLIEKPDVNLIQTSNV